MPAKKDDKNLPATVEPAATPAVLPEGMTEAQANAMAAAALGQIGAEGMIVPRIKLLQSNSQEVNEEVAKAGIYFNSISCTEYSDELNVVVLVPSHIRLRLVMGQGLVCRANAAADGKMQGRGDPGIACAICPFSKWEGKTPPECNEGYQYFVLVVDEDGFPVEEQPMAISLMSSAMKEAKKWNTLLKYLGKGVYPWQVIYNLTTTKETNPKGTFYVPKVNKTGKMAPDETVAMAWDFVPSLVEAMQNDSLNVTGGEDSGSSEMRGSDGIPDEFGAEGDLPL